MDAKAYGTSGLSVSRLGLGTGGLDRLDAREAEGLVRGALDLGVTLFDTAPSYGAAESKLGVALGPLRDKAVLSTKLGYGVPGVEDWTGPCIQGGVDLALTRLGTDRVDIAHLHSCSAEVIERGEVVEALLDAKRAGKVRFCAYAGDGHALHVACSSGAFDGVLATTSVLDRHNLTTLELVPHLGRIAKRILANAPWRFREAPREPDLAENYRRWNIAALALEDPADAFLRWAAFHTGFDAVLLGTTGLSRLESAARSLTAGPLPEELRALLDAVWVAHGADWSPII
ncbi:MAG: aldo/keto reductase [Myxococcota bacterium]